ncbi:1,2-phenylacetyl-CoA epoxidase subunit PaaD [Flexivirga caeni]|uniref:Phenylacetate-CoA oxygenase subunit PaaJ n=1 Tax=Flexivirga caeni TaxID=2294115 RepID=A0A3M9MK23_9MICO|nr:1,2-phenylacetyl-CoA epoxidase subunit PaaD [Flexivirga caeni]RNI25527.1 phenylacetate-CoA oxygenase subunit PaaJ [Flexivirga caeni]
MVATLKGTDLQRVWAIASEVTDPELPMLTLADLGVLRNVEQDAVGAIVVSITPTYTGCPAMAAMRDDLVRRLTEAGIAPVRVRVQLSPPWTSDWISDEGRKALRENGISPPGTSSRGPIALTLKPKRRAIQCPQCGSGDTEVTSEFGSTACKALYRCRACGEPFDHLKEH